jgi:hypothetical protein
MKPRMRISTADWLAATIVVALFLLPLWLPHSPMFVQVPIAILVTLGGLVFAASALHNRWRLSKSTGQFLGYYLRLAAVALAIIVAFLLLVFVIGR